MRLLSLIALVVAMALLPLSYARARADRQARREAVASRLRTVADDQAATLDGELQRAERTMRLTAHDPSFSRVAADDRSRAAVRHSPAIKGALRALTFLSRLDPIDLAEASLADAHGEQLAEVVHGLTATQLSLGSVRGLPSYAQARRAPVGTVTFSRPYVSTGTRTWVMGIATPLRRDGRFRGLVQFELRLEALRTGLLDAPRDVVVHVVDERARRVVLDGDQPLVGAQPLSDGDDPPLPSPRVLPADELRGFGSSRGRPSAYRRVAGDPLDANHWVVVATSRARTPSILDGLGFVPVLMLIVGLLGGGLAALGLRVSGRELRDAALTDALTGLPNRRALMADLTRLLERAPNPSRLLLMDLDGFKGYNDGFGHPAGDALLMRLADRLAAATGSHGRAYRLGGDEFCVLCADGPATAGLEEAVATALCEHGEGFAVSTSLGSCRLPTEAATPEQALRVADTRMYARKRGRRAVSDGSHAVLLSALGERDPGLAEHTGDVARLAVAVAAAMGLDEAECEHVRLAADLHDVGKVAIPDAILHKPGPLDDAEWVVMRGHTIVGERILRASPALSRVAELVRASHERWDGGGYPDGTAGERIPLGARIVAVCDAYDAMVADRVYRRGRPPAWALAELHRCAGTQFDPVVVMAFAEVVAPPARQLAAAA